MNIGTKDRHPGWLIFGTIALIAAVIFALPLVLFCLFWQVIFMITIFLLDLVLPNSITVAGFGIGFGLLDTAFGATIGFVLVIARRIVDWMKIKWVYILIDIIFMIPIVMMSFQEYGTNIHAIIRLFTGGT
jgi:hypothetical protein